MSFTHTLYTPSHTDASQKETEALGWEDQGNRVSSGSSSVRFRILPSSSPHCALAVWREG